MLAGKLFAQRCFEVVAGSRGVAGFGSVCCNLWAPSPLPFSPRHIPRLPGEAVSRTAVTDTGSAPAAGGTALMAGTSPVPGSDPVGPSLLCVCVRQGASSSPSLLTTPFATLKHTDVCYGCGEAGPCCPVLPYFPVELDPCPVPMGVLGQQEQSLA